LSAQYAYEANSSEANNTSAIQADTANAIRVPNVSGANSRKTLESVWIDSTLGSVSGATLIARTSKFTSGSVISVSKHVDDRDLDSMAERRVQQPMGVAPHGFRTIPPCGNFNAAQ
jgi:hypothetical protein